MNPGVERHRLNTVTLTVIGFRRPFKLQASLWDSKRSMYRALSWVRGKDFEAICTTYPDDKGDFIGELNFYHGRNLTPGLIAHEVTHATFALGRRLGWDHSGYSKSSDAYEEYHCLRVHKLTDLLLVEWKRWVGKPPRHRKNPA